MEFLQHPKVGTDASYLLLPLIHCEIVVLDLHHRSRSATQTIKQSRGRGRAGPRRVRGKVHCQQIAITRDRKGATRTSFEAYRIAARCKNLQYDMRGSQSSVSAQLHFATGRKPSQVIVIAARHENAVSERLFSDATARSKSSSNHS